MKKSLIFFLFFDAFSLLAQNVRHHGVDTTQAAYKTGQNIGAWIPFVFLLIIVLFYIKSAYRHGKDAKTNEPD